MKDLERWINRQIEEYVDKRNDVWINTHAYTHTHIYIYIYIYRYIDIDR